MGQKLVIGPIDKGIRTDRTAFNIDKDSFPQLVNAYQWRGRVKRKRGTSPLCRLKRFLGTTDGAGALAPTILPVPIGTGIISVVVGSNIFTDPGTTANPGVQTLLTNGPGTATLDRVAGTLTIAGSNANTAIFYYPSLPVMGLEDLILNVNDFPGTMAFDTKYSYVIQTVAPFQSYDVSYYKNPPVTTAFTNYVPKATPTPTWWNGEDYRQFWTVNYQGALWATNGVNVPFTTANIGMQFKPIVAVTVLTPTTANLQITAHGLIVGDFVFINEVVTTTGINFQTGYVTTVTDANNVIVTFPNATLTTNGTLGIAQYLTSRSNTALDCLRWYDGDPTNASSTAPLLTGRKGWVNFAPPLSQSIFSIADLPEAQYYLVGAKMILPFKDRLLFIGPVIQTSSAGSQKYLRDTVIYSQNGTPYYTASFTNNPSATVDDPTSSTITFHPILVPVNQTATAPAYFEDAFGFGGFISAGLDMSINTAFPNEDQIIMGLDRQQSRLVYTGNDIAPFNFFAINSELGSGSTFSGIILDKGVMTKGSRGYIITSQVESSRFDLQIPDQVFQTRLLNNGTERVTAVRDFINEWVYFTYASNQRSYIYPNQTLLYNYRDESWAIFNESYTTYGTYRRRTGFTWATVGTVYPSWNTWNAPWNAGVSTVLNPEVIAGNQQGYVVVRDDASTDETPSLAIQNIVGSTVTAPNHCLNNGDFITINGAQGTVASSVNGIFFQIAAATTNTFVLLPSLAAGLTYLGGGEITRLYVPFIQTMQFPLAWDMARKTRIGPQQYLLSTTTDAQITLLIYLSQNDSSPYNEGPIFPDPNSVNDGLIYSTVLYTCPESTNLGLTPANTNLQMPTAKAQNQIWHRVNTSLLGDTVQLGFTLSKDQMLAVDDDGQPISQFAEIELHSIIIDASPSSLLA